MANASTTICCDCLKAAGRRVHLTASSGPDAKYRLISARDIALTDTFCQGDPTQSVDLKEG
jgi:hypothetical protein